MEENTQQLDPAVKEELKRILSKGDLELNDSDKAFLRARRPYIGKESRKRLAWVFEETPKEVKPENPVYPEEQNDPKAPDNEHPADEKARKEKEEAEAIARADIAAQKKKKDAVEKARRDADEKDQEDNKKADSKTDEVDEDDDIEEDAVDDEFEDAELEE